MAEDAGIQNKVMMKKYSYIYMLASKPNGTLYIGVTSDLIKRVWQHKNNSTHGFTSRYNVKTLVYYEQHLVILSAIRREKQLKKWPRKWKLHLINQNNPAWNDLYNDICG